MHVQNFKLRVRFASTYIYQNQSELIFPAERYMERLNPKGYISVAAPLAREKIHNKWCSKYEVVKIGSK